MTSFQKKQFKHFVMLMEGLMEMLSMDTETEHLVTEDMEDLLYQMRHLSGVNE